MKILHVYKDYFPVLGGIENHVRVLAEAQVHRGHEVTVLVANRSWRTETRTLNGVKVVLAGRLGTVASTPLSPSFFRRLHRIDADIVHLHFPHPPGEIAQWLVGRSRATVLTYHCDIVRQRRLLFFYAPLLRRVLEAVDHIIVDSPACMASSPYLEGLQAKCSVVPLGIDVARFSAESGASRGDLRTRWGLPEAGHVLVFVGRLRYYKGLEFLLRALPLIPGARLLLVGDGPLWDSLHALAASIGVAGRVVFTGDVGDVELPGCYAAGDVFVLPSHTRAESFGTSIIEAMASGLPVVSTELHTGTSWVNQDGLTGLVVPPGDPEALAAGIRGLLEDPDRRRAMGQSALARARDIFQASAMVEGVERVYREVLESAAGPVGASALRPV